jgi:hypothetical protein
MRYYTLDKDHRVCTTKDVLEWGRFFQNIKNRIVTQTRFECGVMVSTVFLGIDHRFGGKGGPPLLFESMVFEMDMHGDSDMWRYSSWDDAETGHAAIVKRVKAQIEKAGLSTKEYATETMGRDER